MWDTKALSRLAVMQESLDALLHEIGNPLIKPNDTEVIEYLLNSQARWFSMSISGYPLSLVNNHTDLNFADLVFIVALCYNPVSDIDKEFTEKIVSDYFKRKGVDEYESSTLLNDVASSTYGLLVFREQVEKLLAKVTGMSDNEANLLVRNLCKRVYESLEFGPTFIKLGVSNGFNEHELEDLWNFISLYCQNLLDYKFGLALAWILYQIEYLQTYHSDKLNCIKASFEDAHNIRPMLNVIEHVNSMSNITDHFALWEMCKSILRHNMPEDQYNNFKDITSISFQSSELTLKVPDIDIIDKIESRDSLRCLQDAISKVYGKDTKIFYKYDIAD